MLQRIYYAFALLSAICLLATLVFWPASYWRYMGIQDYVIHGVAYTCRSHGGRLTLARYELSPALATPPLQFYSREPDRVPTQWSYLTWNTRAPDTWIQSTTTLGITRLHIPLIDAAEVVIPFSYIAILFSTLPALALVSIRRRRKAARKGFPVTAMDNSSV